ncbi:hypothetical protein ACE01N_19710 [Saccharicrinis sp. FJH2]|uniref:hypothetical protein n=1 Tax=Saccharicrinis sp. FJH65 TaxID=3344659 RepID=UPI0035F38410
MKKYYYTLTFLLAFMTSCSTYYMTQNSFKEQLENIDPNKINDAYDFRLGLTGVALKGGKNFYNGIETLKCKDKNGKDVIFTVKPQTGIRLTDSTGRHVQLYFDSVFLRDSLVYGSKSHFITLPVTPMNINKLTKIEIQ